MSISPLTATLNATAGAARGNVLLKAILGLSAMLLVLGPPTARLSRAQPNTICYGYFALCAATTCTPQPGKTITVKVASGGTAVFPEADCQCPIFYGPAFADTTGGNMQGSCEPPGPGQIWSEFSPQPEIPQELNNWAQSGPKAAAPVQICPARLNQGTQLANCFSFLCDSETFINGAPVATCHCPLGESQSGQPVAARTTFTTQAGQGDRQFCFEHPVSSIPPQP